MIALGYVAMFGVGLVLGLMGGGGAILTMPILVFLFGLSPLDATTYSLCIVATTTLFGVWRYHRQKLVDYRTGIKFLIPSVLGTQLARRIVLPLIPNTAAEFAKFTVSKDQIIMVSFALVMLAASVSMIRPQQVSVGATESARGSNLKIAGLGLAVGFIAGFVGAGGGFLIIPSLVVLAGMPMASAVPTSIFIIATNSTSAFVSDLIAAVKIDWFFLAVTTCIGAIGLEFGMKLAKRIPPAGLKVAFGWFVLIVGCFTLVTQVI